MKFIYPAIFTKDDECYSVEFPDLEGCQTFGDTIEEAMSYAQEALAAYILTLLEEERMPEKASEVKNITTENDSFVTLVVCDVDQYRDNKAVKKTLTIPGWLNKWALSKNINFSETLQEALIKKVGMK